MARHAQLERVLVRAVTLLVATLAVLVVVAPSAGATSSNIRGTHSPSGAVKYNTPRTVSVDGSNIYAKENSGYGELSLQWYKCSDPSVHGRWGNVSGGRRAIGTNFRAGTRFCLMSDSAPPSQDDWTGTLWWNVNS